MTSRSSNIFSTSNVARILITAQEYEEHTKLKILEQCITYLTHVKHYLSSYFALTAFKHRYRKIYWI